MKRRQLLVSAAAWGLVAPVLRTARAAVAPRRLILFANANGLQRFSMAGLSSEMQKMAADVLLVDGVSMMAGDDSVVPGIDDHTKGPPVMFTAHVKGKDLEGGRSSGRPLGPSLDQFAVNKLQPPTRFPSVELGVKAGTAVNFGMNLGSLPYENSPSAALTRLLGGVMAPATPSMDGLRARRQSVLDHLAAELAALKPRLAPDERPKLDGHLESLRALEKRLLPPTTAPGTSCTPKSLAATGDTYPDLGRAQMDILAMALACDATRVATLRWGTRTDNTTHRWAGVTRGHHDLAHSDDVPSQVKVLHWFGDQFAYLLGKLKAQPDAGGGTVLDNSVVLWNSDMATGGHGWTNGCMVLGGGRNLGIKTGRVAKYNGATQNDLFLAVLRAIGVEAASFGNPAFSRGPLAGIS